MVFYVFCCFCHMRTIPTVASLSSRLGPGNGHGCAEGSLAKHGTQGEAGSQSSFSFETFGYYIFDPHHNSKAFIAVEDPLSAGGEVCNHVCSVWPLPRHIVVAPLPPPPACAS